MFVDKVFWDISPYREYPIFSRYNDLFYNQLKISNPYILLAVLLLPFIFLVIFLQSFLLPIFGSIIEVIISCLLLIFCLGPSELGRDINRYMDAKESGDQQKIEKIAHKFNDVIYSDNYDRAIIDGIFWSICHRLIAPIFWFLIIGIAGAMVYRFIEIIYQETEKTDCESKIYKLLASVFYILNWVPARVTVIGYAVIGNFDSVIEVWKNLGEQSTKTDLPDDKNFLINAGYAASHQSIEKNKHYQLDTAISMIWRNLTLWIFFVGILSLFEKL